MKMKWFVKIFGGSQNDLMEKNPRASPDMYFQFIPINTKNI